MPDYLSKSDFEEYFNILGQKPVLCKNIFELIPNLFKRENRIVLSDNRIVRGCCKALKIPKDILNDNIENMEIHFSMIDALNILREKNVSVFFYNRIGVMKNGYLYSELACRRMNEKLSFLKMSENISEYENDLKDILGSNFSKEYIDDLKKIPQIIRSGNLYRHEDISSRLVNVVDGKRVTCFEKRQDNKNIHIFGRCGAFGYAVSDEETFPSQLQKKLIENNKKYNVVNHGLWGAENKYIYNNFFFLLNDINEGDIVIFYMKHFDKRLLKLYSSKGMYYKEITDEWHEYPDASGCFFDKPGHMNATGYKNVAEIIYKDLESNDFSTHVGKDNEKNNLNHLSGYLKKYSNDDFDKELNQYTDGILVQYPEIKRCGGKIGSIVMNCNPFTNGHRHLVEYASANVELLIIFVVEEDKSFFRFEDRFEMVKKGTDDISNVIVVPSGKFIISAVTFPEYFLKEYVKEKNYDISQDLDIFGGRIAKELKISVRFAGEEPFDPVTNYYNENMGKVLPQYGVQFEEIPRKMMNNSQEVISATKVRELLANKQFSSIKELVPESTYNILMQRYRA